MSVAQNPPDDGRLAADFTLFCHWSSTLSDTETPLETSKYTKAANVQGADSRWPKGVRG